MPDPLTVSAAPDAGAEARPNPTGRPNRCPAPVPVDLADDWPAALRAAGFDPSRPTARAAEGLTVYLTRAEADLLMTRVHDLSAPGSRLHVEIAQPAGSGSRTLPPPMTEPADSFRFCGAGPAVDATRSDSATHVAAEGSVP
jgi:methyltransferase (TIGR00027 family)